jgi:hypothetical protein
VAPSDAHESANSVTAKVRLKYCICEGNLTASYRGFSKWTEAKLLQSKRKGRTAEMMAFPLV